MAIRILVIDDDPEDYLLIEKALHDNGFNDVIHAKSGHEGVEKAKTLLPDIVVTDTVMMGMNGFEVCEKIRQLRQGKIRVIVQTGVVDAVDAGKAIEAGAEDYCVKTHDNEPLLNAIKRIISSK